MRLKPLPRSFYARDTSLVAKELLGKLLVHKTPQGIVAGKIVETEAYYGERDPASRAFHGKKIYNIGMWGEPGTVFTYIVHANWMFNIATGEKGEPSAVLIRALEPLEGIALMQKRRGLAKIEELCRGPGKLSRAMGITKAHNGLPLAPRTGLYLAEPPREEKFAIGSSHRIGVTQDLKRKLRFFIKDSTFVSR